MRTVAIVKLTQDAGENHLVGADVGRLAMTRSRSYEVVKWRQRENPKLLRVVCLPERSCCDR